MKEENITTQFGCRDEDGRVYKVERSFFLDVVSGPVQKMRVGSLVRLFPNTGSELFLAKKISPVELGEFFEVIRPIRTIQNGEWIDLERGDIVKLTKEEALPLLRDGKIREKKGEIK